MGLKEKMYIDEGENGLFLEPADDDGINIVEVEGGAKVYIYHAEIPKLAGVLRSICNNNNNNNNKIKIVDYTNNSSSGNEGVGV